MTRLLTRTAIGGALATLAIGMFATQASAHVTIATLGTVQQGSFGTLGFNVPNERDDAGTVSLKVQMPQDHPIAFVSVQPKPGWEVSTTTRTLETPVEAEGTSISEVVDTVTWTATGDTQIKPGEFDVFWLSAGTMPTDVNSLSFPAVQTYSSGEEVAWIEPTPSSGEEPEHPVPTLQLVSAGSEDSSSGGDDDDSSTLAVVALVVGAVGLVAGVAGLVVARRRPSTTA
jgi:uncharacterized protein YcnI